MESGQEQVGISSTSSDHHGLSCYTSEASLRSGDLYPHIVCGNVEVAGIYHDRQVVDMSRFLNSANEDMIDGSRPLSGEKRWVRFTLISYKGINWWVCHRVEDVIRGAVSTADYLCAEEMASLKVRASLVKSEDMGECVMGALLYMSSQGCNPMLKPGADFFSLMSEVQWFFHDKQYKFKSNIISTLANIVISGENSTGFDNKSEHIVKAVSNEAEHEIRLSGDRVVEATIEGAITCSKTFMHKRSRRVGIRIKTESPRIKKGAKFTYQQYTEGLLSDQGIMRIKKNRNMCRIWTRCWVLYLCLISCHSYPNQPYSCNLSTGVEYYNLSTPFICTHPDLRSTNRVMAIFSRNESITFGAKVCFKTIRGYRTYVNLMGIRSILEMTEKTEPSTYEECHGTNRSTSTQGQISYHWMEEVYSESVTIQKHDIKSYIHDGKMVSSYDDLSRCDPYTGYCKLERYLLMGNLTDITSHCPMNFDGYYNVTIYQDSLTIPDLEVSLTLVTARSSTCLGYVYWAPEGMGYLPESGDHLDIVSRMGSITAEANLKYDFVSIDTDIRSQLAAEDGVLCKVRRQWRNEHIRELLVQPTNAARNILNRTDITASVIGDILVVRYCTHVTNYTIYHNHQFNNVCYTLKPIQYVLLNKTRTGYILPISNEIVENANILDCSVIDHVISSTKLMLPRGSEELKSGQWKTPVFKTGTISGYNQYTRDTLIPTNNYRVQAAFDDYFHGIKESAKSVVGGIGKGIAKMDHEVDSWTNGVWDILKVLEKILIVTISILVIYVFWKCEGFQVIQYIYVRCCTRSKQTIKEDGLLRVST